MGNKQLYEKQSNQYNPFFPIVRLEDIIETISDKSIQWILNNYNHIYVEYSESVAITRNKVPSLLRRNGLWISYNTGKDIVTEWYQGKNVNINDYNQWTDDVNWAKFEPLADGKVTYQHLSHALKQLMGKGNIITNFPDEEDITTDGTVLSFKNREYDTNNFSGLGRIILRKNIILDNGVYKNILTQDMINKSNTIYEIRYDFDLNGEKITIPEGCVLDFQGGSLNNGKLIFNNSTIKGKPAMDCFISGSLKNKVIDADWFIYYRDNILLDLCKFKNLTINLPSRDIDINSTLAINDGVKLIGHDTTINLSDKSITNLYTYTDYPSDVLYYKPFVNSKQFKITSDAFTGSAYINVEDTSIFNVGDYIQIKNGYCDMWRVMEQYTGNKFDWNNDNVKLWESEINSIDKIEGNTLYLKNPLSINILTTPQTYNLFDDENQLEHYIGYNIPTIQKIGVNSNIKLLNINIKSTNPEQAILFSGVNDCIIDNCNITNLTSEAIKLSTCFNCVISKCRLYSKEYSIRLNNVCYNNIIEQNDCTSEGYSDSVILLMANCYANTIENNITRLNKIQKDGVYINTSKGNYIYNTTSYNAKNAVSIGFCFGNNIVNGINGVNCTLLFSNFYSRHDIITNGCLISNTNPASSIYTDVGLSIINSADINISNITIRYPKADIGKNGRIHIYQSIGIVLDNIIVNEPYIWYSTNIDTEEYNNFDRLTLKDSNVGVVVLKGASEYRKLHKKDTIINTKINNGLVLQQVYNSSFINCIIKGDIALSLEESSMFNDFMGCTFSGNSCDIKFGNEGVRNQLTSLQHFDNCYYTKIVGYDVTAFKTIEEGYSPFKEGQKVSILYPEYNPFNCVYHTDKWYIEKRVPELHIVGVVDSRLKESDNGTFAIREGVLQYWNGTSWKTIKFEE